MKVSDGTADSVPWTECPVSTNQGMTLLYINIAGNAPVVEWGVLWYANTVGIWPHEFLWNHCTVSSYLP